MQPNRVVESLEFAAEGLDTAATGAEVRAAIRDGLLGLEYHLDTLARELQKDPAAPGALEPTLRNRAEHVEKSLRDLLVQAWQYLMKTDEELAEAGVGKTLARQLRAADRAEIALVFDQLLAPQGLD